MIELKDIQQNSMRCDIVAELKDIPQNFVYVKLWLDVSKTVFDVKMRVGLKDIQQKVLMRNCSFIDGYPAKQFVM